MEADKDHVSSAILKRGSRSRNILVVCGLCVFAFALYLAVGVFETEFGAFGDEGMHYVTSLMVRDFVLSPENWHAPMQFARDYYLHFPKVAMGHWPPGFAIIQTIWTIPFGESRISMLVLMTLTAVLLAYLVFRTAQPRYGWMLALLGAAILIAAPLTQKHAAMVMAEIPLAIVCLLATLAFARFVKTETRTDAVWFGVLTSAAILIKGNAWSLIPMTGLALLFSKRLRLLLSLRFWTAAAIIGIACIPFTLLTMQITRQGWNDPNVVLPAGYYVHSTLVHARFMAEIFGYPLTAVALAGMVAGWRSRDVLWRTMVAYVLAVLVFHSFVPTSMEQRKIFQVVPVMALFIVAGLDAIGRALPQRMRPRELVCTAGALLFVLFGFVPLDPFAPGFGPAVERVMAAPGSRQTATLISSNAYFADCEAGIIAEWTERDRNERTYLVRGTKLLGKLADDAGGYMVYRAVSDDPLEIRRILHSIPVATIILHTTNAKRSYPHHELLRKTLELYPEEWERVYENERWNSAQHHRLEIYRQRRSVEGIPVRLSLDLTRKIGRTVDTEDARTGDPQ